MTDFTPTIETRRPSRRSVIAAGAWAAPAIVMTVASPAHAASTDLGVITFAEEPADLVGRGAVQSFTMQLTVPEGVAIPAQVSVAYSTSGVVDGPTTVPTGGATVFTFEVTARDADGTTDLTVSAPGFVPAQTTLRVTADYTAITFLHGSSYGITHKDNVLNQGYDTSPHQPGDIARYFLNGKWGNPSTSSTNRLSLSGIVFAAPGNTLLRGKVDYRIEVVMGGEGLSWATGQGGRNAGKSIVGTVIDGTAHRLGGITSNSEYENTFPAGGNRLLPIVRDLPVVRGTDVTFVLSFPRFPDYVVVIRVAY